MGFRAVFDIRTEALESDESLQDLPVVDCSEEALRKKIIEAHRLLMGLNDDNRAKFSELVTSLESTGHY
jgi:hypothetical protein